MRAFLFVLLCVGTFACRTETARPVPEDVLSETRMVDLLVDMHVYEGVAYQQRLLPYDSMGKLQAYFTQALLARHGISDSMYQQSLRYYGLHTMRLHKIYGRVLDSLQAKQAKAPPLPKAPAEPAL